MIWLLSLAGFDAISTRPAELRNEELEGSASSVPYPMEKKMLNAAIARANRA